VTDRYTLELQALAASLTSSAGDAPTALSLDPQADKLLLAFERDLEPRLAANSGDLAHLAGWAAKLAGATCRVAALLHLAEHLRDGWAHPIGANTLAGAIQLADYLVEHARAVFDLMGADPRVGDACWLLDWISRTDQVQFSRRDAHQAARGRFRKATDLEPALRLLEEHGYLRRVDPEPSRDPHGRGRPASPRFVVNPLHPSSETTETTKTPAEPVSVVSEVSEKTNGSPRRPSQGSPSTRP
jgi:replicative DNA helicase